MAGLFSRLAGTLATFFQIGGPGNSGWSAPDATHLENRTAAAAFAVTRGAPPVGANDYVTLGSLTGYVHITAANSPYSAAPNTFVIVDASAGNVVVNMQALALGQAIGVAHDSNTSLAAHTITVNPSSGNLDQPPPNNGTFVASFVFGGATPTFSGPSVVGLSVIWYNGGSAGGLLRQ
jgi:hypothetical protein